MIRLSNLALARGNKRLLEDAALTVHAGQRVGLIDPPARSGMFHRKNQMAAGTQHPMEFLEYGRPILDVVHHQRTQNNIEAGLTFARRPPDAD